jgi:hypothetical protein
MPLVGFLGDISRSVYEAKHVSVLYYPFHLLHLRLERREPNQQGYCGENTEAAARNGSIQARQASRNSAVIGFLEDLQKFASQQPLGKEAFLSRPEIACCFGRP